jgi:hypothetical protein
MMSSSKKSPFDDWRGQNAIKKSAGFSKRKNDKAIANDNK